MPAHTLLQRPAFRAFLTFRGFMTFGLQMQAVVIGYHLYAITKDPLSLGLIGLAEAIPAICMALYGGHLADRRERRGLLQWVSLSMAVLSVAIALAHYGAQVQALTALQYQAGIYGCIFLGGILRGVYSPAGSALLGMLVPRENYSQATAYSSMVWQGATVLGPTLGGFVYDAWGPIGAQAVVVACILLGYGVLVFIPRQPPSVLGTATESVFESIKQGMAFVRNQRLLLGALSLDMLSVFFGGAVALLPIYAQDILHVGANGLGMLRAADAVGSVGTMYVLTRMGPFVRPWRTLLWAVAGFGVTIIGFGFSTNFVLSLGWLVALGCFDAVSVVIRSTLMQTLAPDHMRGRVSSISSIFVASSNEIGSFESGFTARLMGTTTATIFGGCMTLGIVGLFSLFKTQETPTIAPTMAAAVAEEEREKEPPVA